METEMPSPSIIRILQLSDFHIGADGFETSEKLVDRYRSDLPNLVAECRQRDANTLAATPDDALVDHLASICVHLSAAPRDIATFLDRGSEKLAERTACARTLLSGFFDLQCADEKAELLAQHLEPILSPTFVAAAIECDQPACRRIFANEESRDLLRKTWLEFVSVRCPVDIVVVTGDFVHKGYNDRDTEYRKKLDDAFKGLEEMLSLVGFKSRSRVVIVNGNHDITVQQVGQFCVPTIRPFVERMNAFYGGRRPRVPPDEREFYTLTRFDRDLIGMFPQPARLGLLAFQGEYMQDEETTKDGHILVDGEGAKVFSTPEKATRLERSREDYGGLSFEQYDTIDSRLRAEIPTTPLEGGPLICFCSHKALKAGHYRTPETTNTKRDAQYIRLTQLAERWQARVCFCGHYHGGVEYSANAVTLQIVAERASHSYHLFELANRFPDKPILQRVSKYSFGDPSNGNVAHREGERWRSSCLPSHPERIVKKHEWENFEARPTSLFYPTTCRKHHESARSIKSYISIFGDAGNGLHCCPYPDIYTRYFRWIFDSATRLNSGPSDTIFVTHVGPFSSWLIEPMNRDYFLRQLESAFQRRVRICRLWIITSSMQYTRTDGDAAIWDDHVFKEKMAKFGIVPDEEEHPIEHLLQPKGLSDAEYASYVVTPAIVDLLACKVSPPEIYTPLRESLNDAIDRNKRKDFWKAIDDYQDQRQEGDPLANAFATIADTVRNDNEHWRLWLGQAYRRRTGIAGDLPERLTFAYKDARKELGAVIFGIPDIETDLARRVSAITALGQFFCEESDFGVSPALLAGLRVADKKVFDAFVKSTRGVAQ